MTQSAGSLERRRQAPEGDAGADATDVRSALAAGALAAAAPEGQLSDDDVLADDVAEAFPETGFPESIQLPEEQRHRIVQMFSVLAPLAASLSDELCKEDHGRFMRQAARIEALCIRITAELIALEAVILAQPQPLRLGWVYRLIAIWRGQVREVSMLAGRKDDREKQLAALRQYGSMLSEIRDRPARIHAAAVEHVKRLLMYEDERYKRVEQLIWETDQELKQAKSRDYFQKAELLKAILAGYNAKLEQMEQEWRDKALQKIQESDNCPLRPQAAGGPRK